MRKFAVCALTLGCALAFAQEMPSEEMLAKKRKETVDAINSIHVTPQEIRLQSQSNTAAASAAAKLGSMPTSSASLSDFTRLTRPGAAKSMQEASKTRPTSDLIIFVSLSMPDAMLMQYAVQAKRFKAVLMMRGFVDNKMSRTRETLAKLNAAGAEWQINPDAFKTFKISKVPAIVLATAESSSITEEGCAKPETYTSVYGDIDVLSALDKMSLLGQARISTLAKGRILADRQAAKG